MSGARYARTIGGSTVLMIRARDRYRLWLMTGRRDSSGTIASWPPFLTTRRALAYTGRSRATINRAVAAGVLPVYGRPGGQRGERVFARADLDRWLAGAHRE